ncbi:hypothetical protein Q8F55_003903 [Vanrija albida]|uniref:Amine oxidase domain-containing protein n=1 Tax=Vanrija albida TaxID=181172 RepID=A0ABR3Q595_9TREE
MRGPLLLGALASLASCTALPSPRNSDGTHAQVIILGGGIAGISLARSLITEHNITDILLVEARDELGGRAHTETLYSNATGQSVTVEKGCNWIQGPGKEPILELAKKWGLKTAPQNYSDVSWFQGLGIEADGARGHFLDDAEQEEFMAGYDNFLENAPGYSTWRQNNSLVDLSVRVATSIMDWIPVNPLQLAYEYWNIDYTFAQPPEISSFENAFAQEAGIAEEQDDFVVDQRGYKYLFVQEARELFGQELDDPRLRLSTTVKTIDWSAAESGGDIVVHTDCGSFSAPHVVSTFSVGVLQHQDVHFTPRLPDWKKEAIFTFGMATYQKIFLLFDEMFWGDEQYVVYADPDQRGRYAVWQNINAPGFFPQNTTNNIIMVTATDTFARRNEELSDDEIQGEAFAVLQEMYGADIPQPADILVPRWTLDPLYRGSYSNWPLGALDQHHANLGQPLGGGSSWLHFTGEAMSADSFGYVQGAWDEGINTAGVIAECLSGKCPAAEAFEALTTCAQTGTALARRGPATRRGHGRRARGVRR